MATTEQLEVRRRVLEALHLVGPVQAGSISEVRSKLSLDDFTVKQVRRAIEALWFGGRPPLICLVRFIIDESSSRGWKISLAA